MAKKEKETTVDASNEVEETKPMKKTMKKRSKKTEAPPPPPPESAASDISDVQAGEVTQDDVAPPTIATTKKTKKRPTKKSEKAPPPAEDASVVASEAAPEPEIKKTSKTKKSKKRKEEKVVTPEPSVSPETVDEQPPAEMQSTQVQPTEVQLTEEFPGSEAGEAPPDASEEDGESDLEGALNEEPDVTHEHLLLSGFAGLGNMEANSEEVRMYATPQPLHPSSTPADDAAPKEDIGQDDGSASNPDDDVTNSDKSDDYDSDDLADKDSLNSDDDLEDGSRAESKAPRKNKKGNGKEKGRNASGYGTSSDVGLTESVAEFSESEKPVPTPPMSVAEPEPDSKIPIDVLKEYLPVFVHISCVDLAVQKHKMLVNRAIRTYRYWKHPPPFEPLKQAIASAADEEKEEAEAALAEKQDAALTAELNAAAVLEKWQDYQKALKGMGESDADTLSGLVDKLFEDADEDDEEHVVMKETFEDDINAMDAIPSSIFNDVATMWREEYHFWKGVTDDPDTGLKRTFPKKFERVYEFPRAYMKAALQAHLFNLRFNSRQAKMAAAARKLPKEQGTPEEREWLQQFFMRGLEKRDHQELAFAMVDEVEKWKGRSKITKSRFDRKLKKGSY